MIDIDGVLDTDCGCADDEDGAVDVDDPNVVVALGVAEDVGEGFCERFELLLN